MLMVLPLQRSLTAAISLRCSAPPCQPTMLSALAGAPQQPALIQHRSRSSFIASRRCGNDRALTARRRGQAALRPSAAVSEHVGSLIGTGMRLAIVVARFNELVTRLLLAGALETASRHGVAEADIEVGC